MRVKYRFSLPEGVDAAEIEVSFKGGWAHMTFVERELLHDFAERYMDVDWEVIEDDEEAVPPPSIGEIDFENVKYKLVRN